MSLECQLVSRSLNHEGIIQDLSDNGINVSIIPPQSGITIPYGMSFIVKFRAPSGNPIDIQCKVVRLFKSSVPGSARKIGMEIISQPLEYKEFLGRLG